MLSWIHLCFTSIKKNTEINLVIQNWKRTILDLIFPMLSWTLVYNKVTVLYHVDFYQTL